MPEFVPPSDGSPPAYRFALEEQEPSEEAGGTSRETTFIVSPSGR